MILLHRLYANQFKQLQDVTIRFPDSGSLLIEGNNEAGKSSLFEAIFFALYGTSLIDDRDYRLEHLRGYGAEELTVELDFSIDGRPFSISRRVGQNHTARLRCHGTEGEEQVLTRLRGITERLKIDLALSSDALRNSCFVEQKKLEQLEGLAPADREACVNELLNLRVLTTLYDEHRSGPVDRQRLRDLEVRVEVAELDSRLPALQAKESRAGRRRSLAYLLEAAARVHQLEAELSTACCQQKELEQTLHALNQRLEQIAGMKKRLAAIRQMLTYEAPHWNRARHDVEVAALQVQNLESLAAGLPHRQKQLEEWRVLQHKLDRLQQLRSEMVDFQLQIQSTTQKIIDCDALDQLWRAGAAQEEQLRAAHHQYSDDHAAAREKAHARVENRHRHDRLESLIAQVDKLQQIHAAVESADFQARQAQDMGAVTDDRRRRLDQLQQLKHRLDQRQEARQKLEVVKLELGDLERRYTLAGDRDEYIQVLLDQSKKTRVVVEEEHRKQKTASDELARAETRDALEQWAEAAERRGELDQLQQKATALQGRQGVAETQLSTAQRSRQRSFWQQVAGGVFLVAALLAIAAYFIHLSWSPGVLPLLLFGAALVLLLRAVPAGFEARAQEASTRSELDSLSGEVRGLETQQQEAATRRQAWAARETAALERLNGLVSAVPVSPADARVGAAAISAPPLDDIRAAHETALRSLRDAEAEAGRVQRDLEREQASPIEDLAAMRTRLQSLQQARSELLAATNAAELAVDELRELELSEATLGPAIDTLRLAMAEAIKAQKSLPALQTEASRQHRLMEEQQRLVDGLALEMCVPVGSPEERQTFAQSEKQRLGTRLADPTDEQVRQAETHARGLLDEASKQLTAQETEQAGRRRRLDEFARERLVEALHLLEDVLKEAQQQHDTLQPVLTALAHEHLPEEPRALASRLDRVEGEIEGDAQDADRLPAARLTLQNDENGAAAAMKAFHRSWDENLPEAPPPDSAPAALNQLPALEQQQEEELAAFQEAVLLSSQEQAQTDLRQVERQIHTMEDGLAPAREERAAWQQTLAELLQLSPLPEPTRLAANFPELDGVSAGDTADADCVWHEAGEAIRTNRSDRTARAGLHGIGEDLLDLESEQLALGEARQDIQVRRAAQQMVRQTRESIVSRVMPLTIQNMQRVLPLLTDGRYHEAQWDDATNTVSVYDNQARSYQRKRVFSGGARDQISLALRLAFALATLPGEHQRRPGFLFLDEPLSSFDRSRTRALVELLTQGLLREQFQQVFLVSHSDAFDAEQFDYRIRMDAGRIAESTLPFTT